MFNSCISVDKFQNFLKRISCYKIILLLLMNIFLETITKSKNVISELAINVTALPVELPPNEDGHVEHDSLNSQNEWHPLVVAYLTIVPFAHFVGDLLVQPDPIRVLHEAVVLRILKQAQLLNFLYMYKNYITHKNTVHDYTRNLQSCMVEHKSSRSQKFGIIVGIR